MAAVVHLDAADQSQRVVDAIRATASDNEDDVRELQDDEEITRRAHKLLGSRRNDAYQAALAVLRETVGSVGSTLYLIVNSRVNNPTVSASALAAWRFPP
jgi:3-methyladenine DNA glycosylase Tag